VSARIKLGLVLSGGIAKGAYQLGFLNALKLHNMFEIVAVSSASIGTLNAYAFCCDKLVTANKIWKSIDEKNPISAYKKIIRERLIYSIIDEVCLCDDYISTDLYTVCMSSKSFKPIYIHINSLDYKYIARVLKASVSMAAIMKPVLIDGVNYYDGAIVDNTPIYPILKHQMDLIISVQFDGYIPNYSLAPYNCPVMYVNLQKDTFKINSLSLGRKSVSDMIDYGYNVSEDILTNLECNYYNQSDFIEYIRACNEQMNVDKMSGDYLVRKINTLCKLIRKGDNI